MKKEKWIPAAYLGAFILWTALVRLVDVRPIGPRGSNVGLAALNGWFHRLTGVHMTLYTVTDWLSLIPLGLAAGFGLLGLFQWIRRRSLRRVDRSILVLGGFYGAVLGAYALFEVLVINYRPILIEGRLEPSYPSSTTVLTLCILPTAVMQLRSRGAGRWLATVLTVFGLFMVTARLVSGVHWLTDIIGGILLSGALVMGYMAAEAAN